jgi:magnesium-transporting ATPase (P-type)
MIPYLIPREGRPDSASILSLWTLYGLIGEYGFNRNVYLLELIRRVGILFNFLFAMIISVALAMKFIESDKRKPSAASLVLTPVVLVSVAFAFSFLNFGYTAVSAYLVSTSNLLITTVVAISLQILLQFFGFFYLAGQKTLS